VISSGAAANFNLQAAADCSDLEDLDDEVKLSSDEKDSCKAKEQKKKQRASEAEV